VLILLPPSETKHPGGVRRPFDLDTLAFPGLRPQREAVVDALVELSADENAAVRVLKLSERQRPEIGANARLREAPTMLAVDRYTGVLFDALDASSLDAASRRWLGGHVLIHSAPFGPVGALDRIPAYRLAANTALPGVPPLTRHWAGAVTTALDSASPSFVLDLRSEAYAALGPVPAGVRTRYVRVVADGPDGSSRALNHFNKHAKGAFVRALAQARPRATTEGGLRRWADGAGFVLREGSAPGELDLVV